jgi:hypothetical protein
MADAWARQVEAKMDRGEFVDLKEAEQKTLGELRRLSTWHGRRRRQKCFNFGRTSGVRPPPKTGTILASRMLSMIFRSFTKNSI